MDHQDRGKPIQEASARSDLSTIASDDVDILNRLDIDVEVAELFPPDDSEEEEPTTEDDEVGALTLKADLIKAKTTKTRRAKSTVPQFLRHQDLFLPMAGINRIMKRSLPPGAKIRTDARICMQEAVTEFIGFLTSEMASISADKRSKILNGDDLLKALENLGLENYKEPLQIYLDKARAVLETGGTLGSRKPPVLRTQEQQDCQDSQEEATTEDLDTNSDAIAGSSSSTP